MPKPKKKIPRLKTEEAERAFWAGADSADYVDWSAAQRVRIVMEPPGEKAHP